MPSRNRNRPVLRRHSEPREVSGRRDPSVQTPKEQQGTLKGLLFQIRTQLKGKKQDLDRLKGDIAYLRRRQEKLERELSYIENGEDPQGEGDSSSH